jgi:menaquinone-dependent protoporphyrinogen IX oxidase
MKGMVVYHSRWGNSKKIAEAIATNMKGPLIEGELERAYAFGQELGVQLKEKA